MYHIYITLYPSPNDIPRIFPLVSFVVESSIIYIYILYYMGVCIYICVCICHYNVFIIPLDVSPPSSQYRLLNLCSQRAFHIEKGLHQHSIGLDGGNRSFQEIIFWKATRFQHLRCSCIGWCWTWKWNNSNLLFIYGSFWFYMNVKAVSVALFNCTS